MAVVEGRNNCCYILGVGPFFEHQDPRHKVVIGCETARASGTLDYGVVIVAAYVPFPFQNRAVEYGPPPDESVRCPSSAWVAESRRVFLHLSCCLHRRLRTVVHCCTSSGTVADTPGKA